MILQESGEMYLESILILSGEKQDDRPVRSVDIAAQMGVSKAAVSRAVSRLKDGGFILTDTDGAVTLTESGRAVADKMYARHTAITDLLISLGVDRETAVSDACKVEHVLSDSSFDAIVKHMKGNGRK